MVKRLGAIVVPRAKHLKKIVTIWDRFTYKDGGYNKVQEILEVNISFSLLRQRHASAWPDDIENNAKQIKI